MFQIIRIHHSYVGWRDITNNEFDEKLMVCLQHKIITDEYGNKQDILKLNYEYVNNNLNKWHIEESNDSKFYSIISTYDDKCLNYSGNTLYMQECKNNNNYQEFTIKDDIIYSRIDATKWINGFNIYPTTIKPKKYKNLTCTINIARLGVKCYSNQNTRVQHVDEMKLVTRVLKMENYVVLSMKDIPGCVFVYSYCSSLNHKVEYTDENGTWGKEDDQWCGIGELIYDKSIRIKNKKTQECLYN